MPEEPNPDTHIEGPKCPGCNRWPMRVHVTGVKFPDAGMAIGVVHCWHCGAIIQGFPMPMPQNMIRSPFQK